MSSPIAAFPFLPPDYRLYLACCNEGVCGGVRLPGGVFDVGEAAIEEILSIVE